MFFDSPYFPKDLLDKINKGIAAKYPSDRKPGEADVQFFYRNRKRSYGDFKKEIWTSRSRHWIIFSPISKHGLPSSSRN